MKLSRVVFLTDDYRLGRGESRSTFVACDASGPDPSGRPIPSRPGVSVDLVLGGDYVLVSSSAGDALLVPRDRVKELHLPLVRGKDGVERTDPRALSALLADS